MPPSIALVPWGRAPPCPDVRAGDRPGGPKSSRRIRWMFVLVACDPWTGFRPVHRRPRCSGEPLGRNKGRWTGWLLICLPAGRLSGTALARGAIVPAW